MADSLNDRRLRSAARRLAAADDRLGRIYRAHGAPPLWERPPGFDTLVRIILEQQVSLASAGAVYARLRAEFGPLRPSKLIEAGETRLRAVGLTRQKAGYCLNLARAVQSEALPIRELDRMTDDAVVGALTSIKGIGPWTAHVYLLMALLRPDAWPATDLALAVASRQVMGLGHRPDPTQMLELAEPWRPWRAVAARMLWQSYLAR